ncbi:oligosaccharide flippase family protein [Fulvivirga sediminis]|uniref:Oligosaccharide flippase family protein n=1 Tax=Fulvivirga sediminis TaxID=2803949 RepID=A0A937JWS9_9BACT|nr:oligosaccharide flippase family protein [Fulvivirga sediminis]MBL3654833.1 oligosaccharide flippase family protein [Fulvivirga sediminis]
MKVFRNLLSNLVVFAINIFIGLWLPPFIVNRLGVGAYGLIPLASSIGNYAMIVAVVINGSVARYLMLDLAKSDYQLANKTFNTCFGALTILFLVLTPLLYLFSFNIEYFINVPDDLIVQGHYLFIGIFCSFILSTYTSLFNTSPYVNNRLDLINLVNVTNVSVRLISIISFFYFAAVSLTLYGGAYVIGGLISLYISFKIFKRQTPFLKLDIRGFDVAIVKEILTMGGWLLVSQIGALFFLQADLFIINVFKGAKSAGLYGILLPWNVLIRTFGAVIAGVISPVILKDYAEGKIERILKISSLAVKFLGILISLIVSVLCIYSDEILRLWVGNEYSNLKWLLIALIFHLGINLSVIPLFAITNAHKKVKLPGIVTLILGIINVVLAILLLKYTELELFGVAIAGFIVLTFKNVIFAAPYTAYILGQKKTYFLKDMLPSLFCLLIGAIIALTIRHFINVNGWVSLIVSMLSAGVFSCLFVFFSLVKIEEKQMLKQLILSFWTKS